MDFSALRALATQINFSVLGITVLVTRPDVETTETLGIWMTPVPEDRPIGPGFQRRDQRREMAIRRTAEIDTVPTGSVIEAPERSGDEAKRWKVDGVDRTEADHVRVVLVEIPDED